MGLVITTLPQCPLGISPRKPLSVQLELLLVGGRSEWKSLLIDKPNRHRSSKISYDLFISSDYLITDMTMTDLLSPGVGEFTISMGFVGWVSLERFPTFERGCGTDYLGGELDFTVQRG